MNFCHLHSHNFFSLLDGLGSPEQYAIKAKELGYKYLGITNHGSTDGLIKFQKCCEEQGVIPISGIEFYIVPNGIDKISKEKRGHIIAWIKNEIGYYNVLRMITISNLDYFYHKPRIDFDTLLKHLEGLCIGTACSSSFLNLKGGVDFLKELHKKIGDDLYLEIMSHNYEDQWSINLKCLKLSKELGIKLIVTHDSHYVNAEDAETHEVLLACQTKKTWNDPTRWKFNINGLYLCEPEFIKERFKEYDLVGEDEVEQAMQNTIEIAQKCENFRIKKQEIILPLPPQYKGMDENKVIWGLCKKGIEEKFGELNQEYYDRLIYELKVIKEFGVIKYFLIVADIVNWCEQNDILVGPGRGSAAGSLVSYILNITKVDPIKYGLLFERFLNPGRKGSLPDIDIDFPDNKRDQIVTRLKNLYGENNIAGITTFLKIEDKTAVRDVARVFGTNLQETNIFSKSIVDDLETALETPEGKEYQRKYPDVVKHALKLRGQVKSHGRHAAASIISPIDLTEGTRAYLATRSNQLVVGLDGSDSEYQGLVKLDILGLSTLSTISMCLDLIKKNHNKKINLQEIKLDDQNVYNEINKGNTVGCFQISTHALTSLIKEVQVNSINELSDAVALVRPGAFDSGATAKYIERKHGETWEKKHPIYEEITKNTHGQVVYQEQLINVIHKIAGLSLAVADDIRKIVGKKRDPKLFEKYKEDFINGCLKNETFSKQEALDFWEELGYHASYSFNYSHALSYSIITYWTCWLKYYYPTEFICASLTFGSEGQKPSLAKEAQRLGLEIIPPRIGISDAKNWEARDNKLYIPFIEVKGLGPKMVETIDNYTKSLTTGFFGTQEKPEIKGKLKSILDDIGAFTGESKENIDDFFDLGVAINSKMKYSNLFNLVGGNCKENIQDLLIGNIKGKSLARTVKKKNLQKLNECNLCGHRDKCNKPVPTTFGEYNVLIVDEYPGWQEDKKSKQMIGEASTKMFFPTLYGMGYERTDFCLTSAVKCMCKNPELSVVNNCKKWLKREVEIIKPFLILAIGNTGLKMFKNQENGIMRYNAETEWNEEFGCWICFCMSPVAAILHCDAKELFVKGINNFVQKLEDLGNFK